MSDELPGFGVDFQIDAGDSFAQLAQLHALMQSTEVKILGQANAIEKATRGMVNTADSAASVRSFATTATGAMKDVERAIGDAGTAKQQLDRILAKATVSTVGPAATGAQAAATREIAATERAVEGVIASLIKEAAAVGKTREELREMKIEALAVTAAQQGNADAADRLLASARALAAARQAQAEDRYAAELAASAAAAREEAQAQALLNAQLLERSRLQAALDRTDGSSRPRATDAGATFSALAAKAAEDEARAADLAAAATKRLADEHSRLAAMVQASRAEQLADAASLERIRASTDPLYAATSRLNAEIAESTRLYHAGVTSQGEYARQQQILTDRLRTTALAHDQIEQSAKRNGHTMQQLGFQVNDVVTMAMSGAHPMQIFATQAGQIFQVAQMAEGGVKGFSKQIAGLALGFLPLIAVASVAGVAFYRWHESLNKDANLKKYAEGLGLTKKEMKELKDVGVTTGDVLSGVWKTISDRMGLKGTGKKLIDYLFSPNDAAQVGNFVAEIYGLFVGGYKGIIATWGLLPAAMKDLFIQAVNASAAAIEMLVNKSIGAVNSLAAGANALLGTNLFGKIDPVQVARMENDAAGAAKKVGTAFVQNVRTETKAAMGWMKGVVAEIGKNSVSAAEERLRKQRDKIVADRNDKKDKPDRHAEALARDAAAIEAQIRNLYALADAYGVSGAAALIAEARVKAESEAIKRKNKDVEEAISRQVQLAIAQRVVDAAKATATMRDQAAAQQQVNAAVAAGLIPAERAADLVRDQLADLPLLAAIQAAQQRGLATEAARATKALEDQRAARADLQRAEETRQFNTDMAGGRNQLEQLREELRLVGATDAARVHALATLKATQEAQAKFQDPAQRAAYIAQQVEIADAQQRVTEATDAWNASLSRSAELFDQIDQSAQRAASGMADAFGNVGAAIGDALTIVTGYYAQQARLEQDHQAALRKAGTNQKAVAHEQQLYAMRSSALQIGAFGDMAAAAKGFFKEGSEGYQILTAAEKAFRLVQFAMSVRAIAQDAIETGSALAKSAARTAAHAVEAVVKAISSLPFPLNIAAGAATIAALAGIGVSVIGGLGGGKNKLTPANDGTGTVLGDTSAKSDSIKRSIDALKAVDTVTNTYARDMAASLRSIDSQIGNVASLVVRTGVTDTSGTVFEGFKPNAIGSLLGKIPLIGGFLSSLFGSKTTVLGNGLYGSAQSLSSILSGGFNASAYTDIEKTSKFLGITTGKKTSTQYSAIDPTLGNQFTLILRSFNDAITAAAGPLGQSTQEIQNRLSGFIVDIGKIDLKGLTGEQIQEKLTAVFGAAADKMAAAASPGIERFQKVGEGAFETLVRVSSTVEAVTNALDQLGTSTRGLAIDAKLGLADQFDSVSDLTSATTAYFEAFYTKEEQAAAKTAQFARVFDSLGMAMPSTLAGFRQLVEAQDLNTAAGQAAYATLLKLAPAFADLQAAMEGAKSAADIAAERQDLQRQLLELQGNTAAIRALDLAKLDASNRELQQQIWAIQDAQDAAKAADELRQAWTSVGDSIMDEVKRIRGLTDAAGGSSFASLQGQFNAATAAARAGDQDAAKSLPGLSQALLAAAADQATSRQELARIQAMTASSLEATYGLIGAIAKGGTSSGKAVVSTSDVFAAINEAQSAAASAPAAANDDVVSEIKSLREEVSMLRSENNSGQATIAGNTGRIAKRLEAVTDAGGGEAIAVVSAA